MIDLLLDEDQQALLDVTVDFLSHEFETPPSAGRAAFDRGLWDRCADLGWYSLALDEADGGMGLSIVEEILVCREIGRRLLPVTYLATMTATRLASITGGGQLASDLAAGKLVVGLAERQADGRTLVWDTAPADAFLLSDRREGSMRLVEGLVLDEATAEPTIDPDIRLVEPVDEDALTLLTDAEESSSHIHLYGAVLAAAMLTGIAEQVRDDSVAYAKARVQYGKPIGSFQAVKHRCSDMALKAERAWAQTIVAALQIRAGGTTAAFEGRTAKVIAADAAISNAQNNIQNHGGIGFTAEHSAHRYLKRAHVLDYAFGAWREHLPHLLELEARW
jgi:alkylation response protein AidB-like acyl-CoA dehydrogenase